jgi:hypothetical protein
VIRGAAQPEKSTATNMVETIAVNIFMINLQSMAVRVDFPAPFSCVAANPTALFRQEKKIAINPVCP